ncbi:hypothetical protein A3Q56_00527 [Intoshia linei]|uniref:Major facilitator superfamily (MFS) profile domain-containing protein n=1 Tax=Intoshia linei TaxID=1819745 RepID=A0A177BDP7_9BILA|nr:hypothetical protein A3Q56_00527 [Intoshia linei]
MISGVATIGLGFLYKVAYLSVVRCTSKRQGIALGITTVGSSVGGVIFPHFLSFTHTKYSKYYMYIVSSAFFVIISTCSIIYINLSVIPEKKTESNLDIVESNNNDSKQLKQIVILKQVPNKNSVDNKVNQKCKIKFLKKANVVFCIHIFKNPTFIFFLLCSIPLTTFSSNPYIYIVQHLKHNDASDYMVNYVFSIVSVCGGLGKFFIGFGRDKCKISAQYQYFFTMIIISSCHLSLAVVSNVYLKITLYAVYSFFQVSQYILPIFCFPASYNPHEINVAYSYYMAIVGIFVIIGGRLSVLIKDTYPVFSTIYYVGGITSLVGAMFMLALAVHTKRKQICI